MRLQVEGLGARRDGGRLADVSFSLPAGAAAAVIGPNGAGKSALLSVLSGERPAEAGRILLDGREVTALGCHERVRLGLGFVPGDGGVFRGWTVDENLRAGGRGRTTAGELRALRSEFGPLAARGAQRVETLSGGERRLLCVARALAGRPSLLLVDEPFAGLMPGARELVARVLARRRALGLAVLVAEARAERLPFRAEPVLELRAGRLAG